MHWLLIFNIWWNCDLWPQLKSYYTFLPLTYFLILITASCSCYHWIHTDIISHSVTTSSLGTIAWLINIWPKLWNLLVMEITHTKYDTHQSSRVKVVPIKTFWAGIESILILLIMINWKKTLDLNLQGHSKI